MRIVSLFTALLLLSNCSTPPVVQELGSISFPTSGSTAAQAEFERGVLLMHSFEYAAAGEAFQRAQALDSGFAMAYWGEALSYTHHVWNQQDAAAARAALQRLGASREARLAAAPTPREKAYGEAVEVLYGDGPEAQRDTLYALAMERVAAAYPDDDEAKVLHATALFGLTQGARDVPLYMRAGAIAQDVFRRNPRHPGAAHMIIHAFDDPVHSPLGLYAARAYSEIAPAAAHAQHMTTHIFLALGMWQDVVSQNVIAAGRDSATWKAGHYTHWLLYAYLQQGRRAEAGALLKALADHGSAPGAMANFRSRYVMESEEWDGTEAHALAADTGAAGEDGYAYATFVTGYAAAKRGDMAAARTHLGRLAAANGKATTMVDPGARGSEVVPVIMELSLGAELAWQAGKSDAALAMLRRATALEEGMPAEFGPPAVVKPSHELLASLYRELGNQTEAAGTYERALQLQPGRSAALLGLAATEKALGHTVKADLAMQQLQKNWSQADADVKALAKVH